MSARYLIVATLHIGHLILHMKSSIQDISKEKCFACFSNNLIKRYVYNTVEERGLSDDI